jgi:hypothetical protein
MRARRQLAEGVKAGLARTGAALKRDGYTGRATATFDCDEGRPSLLYIDMDGEQRIMQFTRGDWFDYGEVDGDE